MRIGFNRPLIKSGAFDLNAIRGQIEKAVMSTDNPRNAEEFLKINKTK